MANTKIPVELSSTPSISDSGDATAITIDSSENTTFSGDVEVGTTAPKINLKNTDTSIVADQSLGVIEVESSDGSTGSAGTIAKLDIAASGAFDGSGHGSDFRFTTGATNQSGSIALSEVMRITSTARVGIGKTDPNYQLVVAGTNPKIQIYDSAGSGQTNLYFGDSGSNLAGYVIYQHSDNKMRLGTNATDRMTISSAGQVTTFSDAGTATLALAGATTGDTESAIRYHRNSSISHDGDVRFVVFSSGNVQNTNNSYAGISDIKLKENIVDATDKLSDIKQVKVRNYNFIGETKKQLGVIAQELEAIFPNMVEDIPDTDAENNDLGTTTKSVKYSIFVPMLIKAMQEQQTIIEDLKARITTLEGS